MTMYGANADELDRIAKAMTHAADDLANDTGFLSRLLQSVPWVGGVAKAFMSTWESNHARRLEQSVQFLRLTADGLTRNAAQQRDASNDTGMPGRGPGPGPKPGPKPLPADVKAIVDAIKRAFRDLPPWARGPAMAQLLASSLRKFGPKRTAMAVAALAASGRTGRAILKSALQGTRQLPRRAAAAVREILHSAGHLTRPRPLPRPRPWPELSRDILPFIFHEVRGLQRYLPIVVPWRNPFVFDQCYPVFWTGVSVRDGR